MVVIEKVDEGFRVSRVFPCAASMQAGASALERVVPEAFAAEPGSLDALRIERSGLMPASIDVSTIDGLAYIELRD